MGNEVQLRTYEILNALGGRVLSDQVNDENVHFIDVGELSPGNYLIRLFFANGEQQIEELSIN